MTIIALALDALPFILVVIGRLLVPMLIPVYPLPGIIAAMLLDLRDQVAFLASGIGGVGDYQAYDKAFDIYCLAIAYTATLRNWVGRDAFVLGRALWYYRLVGVALFEYIGARWLLLLFANTFEYYFAFIEAIKVARNPFVLPTRRLAMIAAFIWIVVKVPQEWSLHVAQADLGDALREHVFGVPASSPWSVAIENRPAAALALGLLAAAAVLALREIWRWLPPRSWEPTFSADAQLRNLGREIPHIRMAPPAFFGWIFVEKAILVSLVTLSFSRILPGHRNAFEVAIGTTAVIAATTFISHALARRGITWGSVVAEFVVVGVTIAGIGVAVNWFFADLGSRTPPAAFLFLTLLMTLIVVLFDRYKWIQKHWERRPG